MTKSIDVGSVEMNANMAAKRVLYKAHCEQGEKAWDSAGKNYPLQDVDIDDVEYIAGAWRVQNKFDSPIQIVRGQEFVLGERINRMEKNLFEFYRARRVGRNCYGRFIINSVDTVVAKYDTDKETHWAYGRTIEEARAFLGIRLYDEYMDLIHSYACKGRLQGGRGGM